MRDPVIQWRVDRQRAVEAREQAEAEFIDAQAKYHEAKRRLIDAEMHESAVLRAMPQTPATGAARQE